MTKPETHRQMLAALHAASDAIEEATEIMHAEDATPVTALQPREIERIYLTLCGVLVKVNQAIEVAQQRSKQAQGHYDAETKREQSDLLAAARLVLDRWSSGDLADAVRQLDAAVEAATERRRS